MNRKRTSDVSLGVICLLALFGIIPSAVKAVQKAGSRAPHHAAAVSASTQQEDVQQLVRDVVWNEVQSQIKDQRYWRFRESQEDNGASKLLDVIQTPQGDIHRLIGLNGRPLTDKEREAEDARIEKLVKHPSQIADARKKREQDESQERAMLKVLPQAFVFHEKVRHGSTVELAFTPNPSFHPNSHETEVFHHMEGTLVVDANAKRLVEINGRLTSKVKFGGGLLGHLDEGGTFLVQQRYVTPNHWDSVLLDVHMDGKALFFKTISVRQRETYSDYQEVPGNTTLQEAAQELKRSAASPSAVPGN